MSVIQPQKMQWVDTSAIGRSRYLSFAVRNVLAIKWLPSGKLLHNYGKIHHFVGKSTISMTIFNSKLVVYQRVNLHFPMVFPWFSHGFPMVCHPLCWKILRCASWTNEGPWLEGECSGVACWWVWLQGLLRNPGVWIRTYTYDMNWYGYGSIPINTVY